MLQVTEPTSRQHVLYIAGGGCPWVEGKTWCNGDVGHLGAHWATHLKHDGTTERVTLRFTRKAVAA